MSKVTFGRMQNAEHRCDGGHCDVFLDDVIVGFIEKEMAPNGSQLAPAYVAACYYLCLFSIDVVYDFEVRYHGRPVEALSAAKRKARELLGG